MKLEARGFFTIKPGDTYIVLDKNRNEVGKLDGCEGYSIVTIGDLEEHLRENEIDVWFDDNGYILTKDSPRYVEYNPNPKGNTKANDCTIRAYCAAENMEWDDAYDIACKWGKNVGYMPNDGATVKHICEEEFGYTRKKLAKDEKGMTVSEFAIKHNEGTFLVEVAKHLVAVIDGQYYDSWDSGKKKIRGFYSKA